MDERMMQFKVGILVLIGLILTGILIVLFGEMLPESGLNQLDALLDEGLDLVVSIGTTSVFPYISGPVWWAQQAGVPTVEINPGDTEVSRLVTHRLRRRAAEALPEIWRRLHPEPPIEG